MSNDTKTLPFSQRNGFAQVPPQLKIGEVSRELRRLFNYSIYKEIERVKSRGAYSSYFTDGWKDVAADFHVKFLSKPVSSFKNDSYNVWTYFEYFVEKQTIGPLFNLIEFLAKHPGCSNDLKRDLANAFIEARAAYRLIDNQIVAIGTAEQAAAVEQALVDATTSGIAAARRHLVKSGEELREGNWSDSVRESIHAVEAMARKINPQANTLGPALKKLERQGYIHGSLKAAFEKLYGYTNDERGIRHALSDEEAQVDEGDALFMLGTCASFVSYLIAKSATQPDVD